MTDKTKAMEQWLQSLNDGESNLENAPEEVRELSSALKASTPEKPKRVIRDASGKEINTETLAFQSREKSEYTGGGITNVSQTTGHAQINDPMPNDLERSLASGFVSKGTPLSIIKTSLEVKREVTGDYIEMALPSCYQPYDFSDLRMRGLRHSEQELLCDWVHTRNNDFALRAIDATLSHPVVNLTIQDFIYLMYVHRDISYPKNPEILPWKCETQYLGDQEFPGCGHDNLTQLKHKTIAQRTLDDIGFNYQALDTRLDLPRASLYCEYVVLQKDRTNFNNYEQKRLLHDMRVALWEAGEIEEAPGKPPIKPKLTYPERELRSWEAALYVRDGETLQEKYETLKGADLELMQLALNLAKTVRYGVQEAVLVQCEKCGTAREYRLILEPASFVP